MGGEEEFMRHPSRVGEAEGEPGQPKVRTPGEKSKEVVTSQTLEVSQSVPRKTHAFAMRAQCLW